MSFRLSKTGSALVSLLLSFFVVLVLWLAALSLQFLATIPFPSNPDDLPIPGATQIYSSDGTLLYTAYDSAYRLPVDLEEIPDIVQLATLASEDKRFYQHGGIDFTATARAAWYNLTHDDLHGASTLTQQLARTAFLNREQTLHRKVEEALIAYKLEQLFTKDEILEMYLNTVPYGGVAVGIEAASQQYFSKSVGDLSEIEAVFLASLTPAPSVYGSTTQSEEQTHALITETLSRMVAAEFITEQEAVEISHQPLGFEPLFIGKRAPHAVDYILAETQRIPNAADSSEGLIITTSLDLELQETLEQYTATTIANYATRYNMTNAATVVADAKTGSLQAMVGSPSYWSTEGQYNAATATRQLGSTLKIIPYALALEGKYSPETLIKDTPVVFKDYDNYRPKNYDNRYHGTISFKKALANSYNIPAIKLTYILGVKNVADLGYAMGISEYAFEDFVPLSLAIGGVDTTLLNLTQAYQTVANGGEKIQLGFIETITTHDGRLIYQRPVAGEQVISEQTAYELFDMLSDARARQSAFGRPRLFEFPTAVAIKTGTSNDVRDNVAVAFTQDFVVASWVGNNDNSSMRGVVSGSVGASLFMNTATKSVLSEHYTATNQSVPAP